MEAALEQEGGEMRGRPGLGLFRVSVLLAGLLLVGGRGSGSTRMVQHAEHAHVFPQREHGDVSP